MAEALYRFYTDDGRLLYVGITRNPERRFSQHAARKRWWRDVRGISIEWYESRGEVEAAERRAIHVEKPLFNVVRVEPRPHERQCGHCDSCVDGLRCYLYHPAPDEDRLHCDRCGRDDCLYELGLDCGRQEGFSRAYDLYVRGRNCAHPLDQA